MEGSEADQILFLSLRDLGFSDFPADDVSDVSDLRPRDVIAICLFCLHAVRGGGVEREGSNPIPTSKSSPLPSAPSLSSTSSSGMKNRLPLTINDLPSGASERYLLCSTMASEVHALGYPGQVTFQQFLYPDPDQLRQLLRFLVGKAAAAAEHRHRRSRSGRSTVKSLAASFGRSTDADVGLGSGGGGGGGRRGDAGCGRRRERSALEEAEAAVAAEAPAAASAGALAGGESEGVSVQGSGGVGAARSSGSDAAEEDWATPQGSPSGMSRRSDGSAVTTRGLTEGEGGEGEAEVQWRLHGSATMLSAWDSQTTFDEGVGVDGGVPASADALSPSSDDGALEGVRGEGLREGGEAQARVKEEEEDDAGAHGCEVQGMEGSNGVRDEVESASGRQQPAHLEQLQRHIAFLRALLDEEGESVGAGGPVGGMRRAAMTKRRKKKTREEHLERVGALERSIARQEEALSQSRSDSLAVQRDYNRALERLERVRLLVDTSVGRAAMAGKPAAAAQLPPALHALRQQFALLHDMRDALERESARAESLGVEVAAAEARWRGVAPRLREDVAAVRQENEALKELLKENEEHKR